MANGYPITDPRSGYDPQKPYDDRDPRFYAAIYYNGSSVLRLSMVRRCTLSRLRQMELTLPEGR